MNFNDAHTKQLIEDGIQLFYVRDASFAKANQVYGGHDGKGINLRLLMTDYGKYAMVPTTLERCKQLIQAIMVDSGLEMNPDVFQWEIVPMTQITLCNFFAAEQELNYEMVKQAQILKFGI